MSEEVTYTEVEAQAMEHGWKPKDQFEAEESNAGKKWRSAEEFMDRKSLFDKIDDQHKQIRNLERGLKAFADHNAKIEQAAYERAIKDLRSQKKVALEEGDLVKVETINEQIDEIKETQQKAQQIQVAQPTVQPEFQAWLTTNQWYVNDADMRAYADGIGNQLAASGMSPQQILQEVSKRTRDTFAFKFRNPNKDKAVPGEGTSRKTNATGGYVPTPDEERVIQTMIRAGSPITRDEYIKQLQKAKGA